jgi:hypothetical protein
VSNSNHLIRKESQYDHLANRASGAGDLDMVPSPVDGKLVVVAMDNGIHVCGSCLEPFEDEASNPRRRVEFTPPGLSADGQNHGTRIFIHAKCAKPARSYVGNLVNDVISKHQARRLLTKVTKPFLGKK